MRRKDRGIEELMVGKEEKIDWEEKKMIEDWDEKRREE
jgi:hypothetical protein